VSILQQGVKYRGVNTRYLSIDNVDPRDGGLYACRTTDVPPDQITMNVVFRGTQSKLDKYSQTKPIDVYALT
jgi:hypothetical protein